MVDVAVNAAIGAKPQQMQGPAAVGHALLQRCQLRCVLQLIVAHGVADPHQFLTDDPPGADGEMAHLGVAHLLIGQPHMGAAGLDQRVGIGMPKRLHHWRVALADGVVFAVVAVSPTIQNGENDWGYSHVPS